MASARPRRNGFTLIELMVTLVVIVVLLIAAYPSFMAVRQRAALRGAADQVLSFWNQSRMEAAKRNVPVKIGFVSSGANFCVGATTLTPSDGTPCDCAETNTAAATYCNVGRFPVDQGEWRGVTITTSSFGTSGQAVIEPKRTSLVSAADAGSISLNGPPGSQTYRLNVHVDPFGRGVLCQSSATDVNPLPDFNHRKCAD